MAEAKTFDIAGHKVNRWVVYGTVGVATVGGVLYFRSKSSSSSSASGAANPSATDPVTGLPYSEDNTVDPLTGLTYLSEAEQYGSVAAAESAVAQGYSAGGYGGSGEGYSGEAYGEPTENYQTAETETYATNQEWAAAVQAALPGITGDSAADVAAAVANYLAGLPLTAAQANDIQVALAEFGPPPSGSFSIITQGSGSGATSTGSATSPASGATTVTAPAAAPKPITVAPTGFRVVSVTNGDDVNLAWNPVKVPAGEGPLTGYMIAYGPTSGSQQYKQQAGGQTTEATVPGVGAGSAGKHYFELWALPARTGGPHAGPIEATTTKS